MTAIDIARQLAKLGQTEGAVKAYNIAIQESGDSDPAVKLEGALYILQNGGDYKVSYSVLVDLYRRGQFPEECLSILTQAFYEPNEKLLKSRYRKNCKLLSQYPYLFRRDFPAFEELPLRFYPFDDAGYLPFRWREGCFEEYIDVKKQTISRNFFRDLDRPILAEDVYSQYELEYLNDAVRRSEDIGRENHVYLHYSNWDMFCAYLQVLNIRPLLDEKKLVFLIEGEKEQYPIDFKDRFGIDYSTFPVRPIRVREVTRMIWNMQLSSHNGGNFFNEIFDGHPNLLATPSIMIDQLEERLDKLRDAIAEAEKVKKLDLSKLSPSLARSVRELCSMPDRTDKDLLVASFLADDRVCATLDPVARIAPILFLQPHFPNILYKMTIDSQGRTVLRSEQYETIRSSPVFQNFKYIKTFTPMRRITTGYGATIRYMKKRVEAYRAGEKVSGLKEGIAPVVGNELLVRVYNRSFMADPDDRMCRDSILVRFEDGKLNPKATFTALAAFLDLPYTESMTYCSLLGERDPESLKGDQVGFSTVAIYREYDDYANDAERAFIEYFMRDAYEKYGYEFHYYDGCPVDEEQVNQWISGFTTAEHYICDAWKENIFCRKNIEVTGGKATEEQIDQVLTAALEAYRQILREDWHKAGRNLLRGLKFVNKNGQPLHMIPKLELDPELLEHPLYH